MADNGENTEQQEIPEQQTEETTTTPAQECTEEPNTEQTSTEVKTEPEIKTEAEVEPEIKKEAEVKSTEATEETKKEQTENGAEQPAKSENGEGDTAVKTEGENKVDLSGDLINETEDNEFKMFVGGLSWDTEEFGLEEYFSSFGEVKSCTIKKDGKTERSRGFGFVLFKDKESVDKVLAEKNHHLDGRKIDPKQAQAQRADGKCFVGGIKSETDDTMVKEYFTQFGEIETFERPVDKSTGKPRGFCFITFKKDGKLALATRERQQELDGKQIEVKEAQNSRGGSNRMGMGRGGGNWMGPQGYGGGGGFGYGGYGGGYESYGGYGGGHQGGYGGFGGGGQGGYGNYGGYNQGYGGGASQQQGGAGKAPRRGMGGNSYKPY